MFFFFCFRKYVKKLQNKKREILKDFLRHHDFFRNFIDEILMVLEKYYEFEIEITIIIINIFYNIFL